jgi:hypothetical protein
MSCAVSTCSVPFSQSRYLAMIFSPRRYEVLFLPGEEPRVPCGRLAAAAVRFQGTNFAHLIMWLFGLMSQFWLFGSQMARVYCCIARNCFSCLDLKWSDLFFGLQIVRFCCCLILRWHDFCYVWFWGDTTFAMFDSEVTWLSLFDSEVTWLVLYVTREAWICCLLRKCHNFGFISSTFSTIYCCSVLKLHDFVVFGSNMAQLCVLVRQATTACF